VTRIGCAALVVADAVVLGRLRPHADLLHHIATPHAWLAAVGADRAAVETAAAALWLVAAWLAVGLAASCCARVPGVVGRCADVVAVAVLPRAVYRLAAGAAGLGVVLAPGLASASPAPDTSPAAVMSAVAPVWPTDGASHAPAWPTTPAVSTAGSGAAPRPVAAERNPARTVVVLPGDSLWRIAAAHLPATAPARQVAAAWPRWYAANRQVIGDDPSHITPGQVLRTPSGAAEEGPR
jgi:hypothetical protein